jgi:outer membrane protein assembly factor BamE
MTASYRYKQVTAMNTTSPMKRALPHTSNSTSKLLSRALRLSAALVLCSFLAACGSILYRADVAQGNFVSKEQVAALKPGMPRLQVADILGTPLLVSVFHADRWEYVFRLKRNGVDTPSYKLTVYFKGDALEKIDGSNMPTEQEFIDSLDGSKK